MIELSVLTNRPLRSGSVGLWGNSYVYGPRAQAARDITDTVTAYSHGIDVVGGFDSASIDIVSALNDVSFWLQGGIGRDVRVRGPHGNEIWRGFVESVEASVGGARYDHGPYSELANKVRVKYTTKRWDTIPPIGGQEAYTDWQTNTESIARYGTIEAVLSGGEGTNAEMVQMREQYLASHAFPQGSVSVVAGITQRQNLSLRLELRGYIHQLKQMAQEDSTTGEDDVSNVISGMIDPTEMPWVDLDKARFESNTTQTGQYYSARDSRTKLSVLKEKAEKSDSSGNRYVFGFYEDGSFVYESVPTYIEYIYTPENNYITRPRTGDFVPFTDLRPGKWLFVGDDLAQEVDLPRGLDELRRNRNCIFVEKVDYTYPQQVSLNGIKLESLRERIDSLGLGSTVN